MATDPDPEEFIEEDEQDELARRSIFAAGWFRALLVLTVLAIIVVVSLPYLLNWLEPTPAPPTKPQAKVSEPAAPAPAPAAPEVKPPAPAVMPMPSASAPPPKAEAPAAPPAAVEAPKSAQAPAAPSPADRPVGTAPLPAVPAPTPPAVKPAPAAKAETPTSKAPSATKKSAPVEAGQGGYWVQVGAFVEERNAETLSRQLKGESFPVTISRVSRGGSAPAPAKAPSSPAPAGSGQNQLFITGSTPEAVNAALKGKGTAQPVKGGVVVNPPYDLETAMSLSSSLKKEGFKVVIRRAKAAPAPAPSGGAGGTIFHVVRVGGYPDRARAQQVRSELEAKGHPGFLMQGAAR